MSGKFPFDKSAAVEAFKTWAKSQEVDGLTYPLMCQIKQGDSYKTITGVTTIADPSKTVDIVHKEGEVMLLDFWATWCPPC